MGLVPTSFRFIKEANTTVTVELYDGATVIQTIGLQPDKDIRTDENYPNHIIIPINTTGGHANNKFLACPWEKIDFVNSSPTNTAPTTVDGAIAILMEDFFFELGGGGGVGIVQTIKVTLNKADIEDLENNNFLLIPAPGAGKYINVINVQGLYNYSTSAYTGGITTDVLYDGSLIDIFVGNVLVENNSTMSFFKITNELIEFIPENKSLFLSNGNQPISGGEGSLTLYITYIIMDI